MRQGRVTNREANGKRTHRERLLAGMLAAVNDDGYVGANVANVIARAGMSRATFYDHFTDKDDCFLALYRDISRQLLDQVARAVNASSPGRALHAVVRELIAHAENKPAQAQFLASDGLAGGHPALYERERAIDELAKTVKTAHAAVPARTRSPDMPTQAVIGAIQWLISHDMRRGERDLAELSRQLIQWVAHYERPIANHRWSNMDPGPWPETGPGRSRPADERLTLALRQGSHALSRTRAHSQRQRILIATAEIAAQAGYTAATVSAITAQAGLHKHVFYDHFRDKRQAFLLLHELAYQQSMEVGAVAYFGERKWPERVWRCLVAVSKFHADHPAIAHVGLVETHALGPSAIQRLEDSREAFATLLRADGQRARQLATATATEAVSAAIFEIAHEQVLHGRAKGLPRYAYHATYLALAPFLGVRAADRFVQWKFSNVAS